MEVFRVFYAYLLSNISAADISIDWALIRLAMALTVSTRSACYTLTTQYLPARSSTNKQYKSSTTTQAQTRNYTQTNLPYFLSCTKEHIFVSPYSPSKFTFILIFTLQELFFPTLLYPVLLLCGDVCSLLGLGFVVQIQQTWSMCTAWSQHAGKGDVDRVGYYFDYRVFSFGYQIGIFFISSCLVLILKGYYRTIIIPLIPYILQTYTSIANKNPKPAKKTHEQHPNKKHHRITNNRPTNNQQPV